MGKTRDLFKKIRKKIKDNRPPPPQKRKKIRDTKGTFHAKMGSIKDRNGIDLTEAKDIKKRCKNTQKIYTKKIFTTQIIMMV